MVKLFTSTWSCPSCDIVNDNSITCQNCGYSVDNFYTEHLTGASLVLSILRSLVMYGLTILFYFVIPLSIFLTVLDTNTIPLILLVSQVFLASLTYPIIVTPIWKVFAAVLVTVTGQVQYGLARNLVDELSFAENTMNEN